MKQWKIIGIAIALVSLAACTGIKVTTDYDTSRDMVALKTYAWMVPKSKLILDPLVDNDLMNQRVRRSVEKQLRAQGFTKADSGEGADFFITYHVSSETKISVSSFHSHYGYYPYGFGYGHGYGHGNDVSVRQYKEGTFMLDVVDPASEKLVWRGIAGRRLSTGTPQERDVYVEEIVTAILAKFPPTLTSNPS